MQVAFVEQLVHTLRESHLAYKAVPVLAHENAHAQLALVAQE